MRRPPSSRSAAIGLAVLASMAFGGRIARPDEVDFARDVRPILEAKCFACHGPKKQKSDLRLDDRVRAFQGGSEGAAIVPGKPGESPLVLRIASADPEEVMPPEGERLTGDQIALVRAWVEQGARWPEDGQTPKPTHWSFQAPIRPELPEVRDGSWPRNPIDRFVLARLESEGLKPSDEADRTTLIRRLSLDLVGLPPTLAEIDAFVEDSSPDAYEKVVDRLLASPHYGERWGRHWLDAARYADSDGFEKDKARHIWFYRDWVIGALNRDLPYDRFIIEQLAGDLLPDPTQDQVVATGYLRNSVINEEGGIDPEQFRMEAMFDRMEAIGKGVLGLTVQCAQCHTHKFDPISHEEYYRLFAFLNSDDEPARLVYTPDEQGKVADVRRSVREIEEEIRHVNPDWRERMDRWEDERAQARRPTWTVVQAPFDLISDGGQRYLPQPDGSFRAAGYAPTHHTGKMTVTVEMPKVTAFRLELMNDPNLPAYGPGRSLWGTCALTEFEVESGSKDRKKVKMARASADFEESETPLEAYYDDRSGKNRVVGPVAYAIDDKNETAWGIDAGPGRRNVGHEAVFVAEAPVEAVDGKIELTFGLKQNHGGWNSDDLMTNNLGRFRISVTDDPEAAADPVPPRVREALAVPRDRRSPEQINTIFSYWRTTVPGWDLLNQRIEAAWKGHPAGATTLVLQAKSEPRMTSILKRGDFLKPGKPVGPGVPAFLHPLPPGASLDRLTFAKWLVARESPTTARSFVNRAWQAYFGTGLVSTPEDLGTQSEPPSHPGLLDWLAVEFMEDGWKVKDLHRLIVNSATYRQSSKATPELLAEDPYNRLLARGSRLRVEGEIVRDIQLAASGLLNPAMGGRSLMPPAPAYLFQPPASYAPFPWIEEQGPDRYRRGIYTLRRRSTPYPMLATFDVPNGNTSCVRRDRSNSPLQALMTLNEPLAVEAARALARLALAEGGSTDADRIAYAFRRCVGRAPAEAECSILVKLLEEQRRRFAEGWVNPWAMVTGANADRPENLPKGASPTQWAAYTVVARVLLNLDETITKE
ncbi:PSD1 and planctomycete cytochrome C domain-containing protein [Tundrisphaera lichenicola]|uniref:PSD1 and planctomycete cytochrome C domain-containing protein n=1 Tax=Tundrisphaera lichenicola TaxID=2029860 RepID=UPI003EB8F3DF